MAGPLPGIFGYSGLGGPSANDLYAQNIDAISTIYPGKDTFSLSNQPPDKKQKKGFKESLKDVGKGIATGAVNTVKGIFTPQGLAMTLGTAGLMFAFGAPVVMPFLIGAGVLAGGGQIFKGALDGDWKKVGEGIFTLGATATGAKFGPKEFSSKGETFSLAKVVKNQDGTTQAVKPTGIFDSAWAYLKAPFRGFGKVENGNMAVTAEGQLANGKGIMSAAGDQFQARFNSGKPNSTTTAAAIPEGSATEAVKPKTNFFTPDGMLGAYGVQASVTGAMIPAQGKL
jgi:hypothetical protein